MTNSASAQFPTVAIRDDMIRLGQFLKLAGLADSGDLARQLIVDGDVSVNSQVETRRGRQLRPGDRVEVATATGPLRAQVSGGAQ